MLDVVCFKWRPRGGYRSHFTAETVNTLRDMVARHYPAPHRFSCVTDDARGLDEGIRAIPLWRDHADLPSPHGGNNPSCYRRLKLFSREAAEIIGSRFVCLDLDCVITGDLRPVWDRPEPFVIWGDTNPRTHYNGSMWLLTAGARAQVWETFDADKSPRRSKAAGQFGSDQGWISACLGGGEATWNKADGVYSYRVHLKAGKAPLPESARIVFFHGHVDPWSPAAQSVGWVREHYRRNG